jgi:protein phosphatase
MVTVVVKVAGRTDIGRVRRRNEDALYTGEFLAAIADGLGGHVAGDVASATVIDAIGRYDREASPGELSAAARQAINDANTALRKRIAAEPELAGMGSTLVAMLWSGATAVVANIGDSRIYLHRDGVTVQITDDHVFGRLVAGTAGAGLGERLTRFLDGRPDGPSPDIALRQMQLGDRYLLCSDGLSTYVPADQIHAVLTGEPGTAEAAERLVDLALDRGGIDNVTAIVIDVD